MNIRAMTAEFIGVLALCFIGMCAIHNNIGLLGIALAHGLAIACIASATGHISGGHLNPAVTFGMLLTGKIKPLETVCWIASQFLGGFAGAALAKLVFPAMAGGVPVPADGATAVQVVVAEFVATFILMFVIFGTAVDKRAWKMGALFIGLAVTFDILAVGPLSGAALNPARHLGPAIVMGIGLGQAWMYWIGPVAGAAAAALLYHHLLEKE